MMGHVSNWKFSLDIYENGFLSFYLNGSDGNNLSKLEFMIFLQEQEPMIKVIQGRHC